jgi:predicted dinucleotide-binding enzyme
MPLHFGRLAPLVPVMVTEGFAMTYAIIGTGAIGSAVAGQFARQGIDVALANSRGPASIAELVRGLGTAVRAVESEEALAADVVILAVPFDAVPAAVGRVADWGGRIVVDASNAIDFPAFTPRDLGGRPSSEVVAGLVPGARVVKAFNSLPAALLAADPVVGDGRRVLFVSGNDVAANGIVAALVERLGFVAVTLGRLDEGGRLQQFGGALTVRNLLQLPGVAG